MVIMNNIESLDGHARVRSFYVLFVWFFLGGGGPSLKKREPNKKKILYIYLHFLMLTIDLYMYISSVLYSLLGL